MSLLCEVVAVSPFKAIIKTNVGVPVPAHTPVVLKGRRIVHGAFGVGKAGFKRGEGSLRLIINLPMANGILEVLEGDMSALPLTSASPPEFHFNNVLRMDVPYHYGASSESRMDVASTYRATARAPADVLRFLGDQSNARFPVFRGGTPVDHALTLDTALITVPEDEGAQEGALLRIYTANPRTAQPVLTRPLTPSLRRINERV